MVRSLLALGAVCLALVGCKDEFLPPLVVAEGPPDAGCIRNQEPNTFDVFFVIDVSGSMGPFLNDLKDNLLDFSGGFSDRDAEGRRVRVNYYTIAYVNDVKIYGSTPMTSEIAVQAAFEEAIARGATGNNLENDIFNAETQENTLDALARVIEFNPQSEAKLVILATDAPFWEAPQVLNQGIQIQNSYSTVYADLERIGARVHAFTAGEVDGITRNFKGAPELTMLPGSTSHRLQDLQGANDRIKETLAFIARESSCN